MADNVTTSGHGRADAMPEDGNSRPTDVQRRYLQRGLEQPGGKLPLFDKNGRRYARKTVEACIANGWAERWFTNPSKPDWLVCKLTDAGYGLFDAVSSGSPDGN